MSMDSGCLLFSSSFDEEVSESASLSQVGGGGLCRFSMIGGGMGGVGGRSSGVGRKGSSSIVDI